jgi:hypothetical protein
MGGFFEFLGWVINGAGNVEKTEERVDWKGRVAWKGR